MDSEITLNANTKYAIVCKCPDGDPSNYISWYRSTSSIYAGGNFEYTSGYGWSAQTTRDGQFEVWGNSISAKQWNDVSTWTFNLLTRHTQTVAQWNFNLQTMQWNNITSWTFTLLTRQWNIIYPIETRYEYFYTEDDSEQLYGDFWRAQTFTVGTVGSNSNFKITGIKLKMFRIGYPSILNVSIRATSPDGKPIGNDLTSGTINASTFTEYWEGEWYRINLTPITLNASTQYAICARVPTGNGDNCVCWRTNWYQEPTYYGGNGATSSDSGETWSLSWNDYTFEILGTPIIYLSTSTWQTINNWIFNLVTIGWHNIAEWILNFQVRQWIDISIFNFQFLTRQWNDIAIMGLSLLARMWQNIILFSFNVLTRLWQTITEWSFNLAIMMWNIITEYTFILATMAWQNVSTWLFQLPALGWHTIVNWILKLITPYQIPPFKPPTPGPPEAPIPLLLLIIPVAVAVALIVFSKR
jgi:hypothetical protein